MHSLEVRTRARGLYAAGWPKKRIAEHLDVSRSTVRVWCTTTIPSDDPAHRIGRCPRCQDPPALPEPQDRYAYLLGQYLGDGHLATSVKVPMLRVSCAATYPAIMDEVDEAMRAVLARKVSRAHAPGCVQVTSYANH